MSLLYTLYLTHILIPLIVAPMKRGIMIEQSAIDLAIWITLKSNPNALSVSLVMATSEN
jgi:hypothetical protein